MPLDPATIDAMLAAGFSAEQMALVMKSELLAERAAAERAAALAAEQAAAADEARRARARAGNRDRQARFRKRRDSVTPNNGVTGRDGVTLPPDDYNLTPHDDSPSDPDGSSAPKGADRQRGTRLPDEFCGSEEARAVCAEMGLTPSESGEALAEFGDYWRGVPGARGRKLDWPATLRNRLREVGRRPAPRQSRGPPDRPASAQQRALDIARQAHLELMGDPDDPGPFVGSAEAHPASGGRANGYGGPGFHESPGGRPGLAPPRLAGPIRPH